ncbi:MAG: pilus assembly protein TadB [Acidobacteria bacterium]|nr:pilus assembly protein TadB [Acidobacteriota bacterium]
MALLIVIFVATLGVTALTWGLVQRTFQNRDAARTRDRLVGRERTPAKGEAGKAPAQQLFLGEGQDTKHVLRWALAKLNIDQALQKLIEQAGVGWTSGQVVASCLLLALIVFNLCWYLAPPQVREVSFVVALGAAALPISYLRRTRRKRTYAFEAQFPDALQFIARAMRAGHAFSVSLEMLHKEFTEPLGGEFRRTFEEQNLGLPIDTALEKLARRMPLLDVQFFVAAVVLQKRTGGNLAEILDKLAVLIRERFKLRGQIRTISAQGRMSSLVLTGIPVVVGVMMYFVNRAHMQFFVEEEIGRWMALLAIGFVAVGYLVMRQIVNIEV